MHLRFPLGFSLFALTACVPPPSAPPAAPVPAPAPAPAPAPVPVAPRPAPAPTLADWRDWPITPGTWAYRQDVRGSIALFGRPGADAEFTIRCDRQRGAIYLSRRADAQSGSVRMTIRTTSQLRTLTALPTGGAVPYVAVELGVRDPLLDAIGFSRGRFVVEGGGLASLAIPAWAEILRVTEDCRG